MHAKELIGKRALRTKATDLGDRSYISTPILILKVTDSHLVYKYCDDFGKNVFGESVRILGPAYLENWTDYDELIGDFEQIKGEMK